MQCKAKVKGKPCSIPAWSNGYCHNHQKKAVKKILILMDKLYRMTKNGSTKEHIKEVQDQLNQTRSLCDLDSECQTQLQNLLVSIRSSNSFNEKIQELVNQINSLSYGGTEIEHETLNGIQDQRVLSNLEKVYHQNLIEKESNLFDLATRTKREEEKFKRQYELLSNGRNLNHENLQKAHEIQSQFNQELLLQQNHNKKMAEIYASNLEAVSAERDELRTMYNKAVASLQRSNDVIEQLKTNDKQATVNVEQLKLEHERALKNLRERFSERMKKGIPIKSERELSLESIIRKKEDEVQKAAEILQKCKEGQTKALTQLEESNQPYAKVALEWKKTLDQLSMKQDEANNLQREVNRLRKIIAAEELKKGQIQDQRVTKMENKVEDLNKQLANALKQLQQKQTVIVQLETATRHGRGRFESALYNLRQQLQAAKQELESKSEQQKEHNQAIARKERELDQKWKAEKNKLEFRYKDLESNLKMEYDQQMAILKSQQEGSEDLLNKERSALLVKQKQVEQLNTQLQMKEKVYNKLQEDFNSELAQRDKLYKKLIVERDRATREAKRFKNIEDDLNKRVSQSQQAVEVVRVKSRKQVKAAEKQVANIKKKLEAIQSSYDKCQKGHGSLITRAKQLEEMNKKFKSKYQHLQNNMKIMKGQYEAQIEQLRSDADRIYKENDRCAQRLSDMSLVHNHIQRLIKDAEEYRRSLEKQIHLAKGNEAGTRKLLNSKAANEKYIKDLQDALVKSNREKGILKERLDTVNNDIYHMRQAQKHTEDNIQNLREAFANQIDRKDAELEREKMKNNFKETRLKQKLEDLQDLQGDTEEKLRRSQKMKHVVEDEYLEELDTSSKTIQHILAASNENFENEMLNPTDRYRKLLEY